jgi:hypothetical protein
LKEECEHSHKEIKMSFFRKIYGTIETLVLIIAEARLKAIEARKYRW